MGGEGIVKAVIRGLLRKFRKSESGGRLTTSLAGFGVRSLVRSLDMRWIDREPMDQLYATGQPFIFAYWHSDLVLASRVGVEEQKRRPIVLMSSNSRDGRIIGDIMARQGMTIVSGSSRRGGYEAFLGLAKNLRAGMNGSVAVDGPRGPRREVKEGIIRLAQMTGHAILPCAVGYQRCFLMRSWDILRVPYPFTSGAVVCGDPIFIDRGLAKDEIPFAAESLKQVLIDLRQKLPYDRE